MKDKLILAAKGFCMGAADVVPGVSGGTMAFILGIYRDLINAIKSFDHRWVMSILRLDFKTAIGRPHFPFLIPLGFGLFAALMFFTRVVSLPRLIVTNPEQIYGLFFGLIVGSTVVLLRNMEGLKFSETGMILPGLIVGLVIFNLVPTQTPEAAWFVFLSGALAICAMILPGISGSFILLILNKYAYIFNAIGHFKFVVIVPFALGCATGLLLFARLLSWLLENYYRKTILFISGLLLASLYVIWPFQERVFEVVRGKSRMISSSPVWPAEITGSVMSSAALVVVGVMLVITLTWFGQKKKTSGNT